eukprot:1051443-Rhodomonas_salina.2
MTICMRLVAAYARSVPDAACQMCRNVPMSAPDTAQHDAYASTGHRITNALELGQYTDYNAAYASTGHGIAP